MNLLADEGVDRPVVDRLRREGHIVVYVAELSPGIADDEIMRRADEAGAPLLTADNDFGELVFRQGRIHAGVVLIRLAGLSTKAKAEVVAQAFRDHATEFIGAFSVVTAGAVRIRRRA